MLPALTKINTPFYLLDLQKLENNFNSLKEAFESRWPNLIIGYSFKTNSLPWIIKWMQQKGALAEVVSSNEFDLALQLGFKKKDVILNGPDKGWGNFEKALNSGSIVNLDSFHEIDWLKANFPKRKKYWEVGLRINFNLEHYCPNETIMGRLPGRFGFNIENGNFQKAVNELNKLNHVKIVGLHGHHSTKTKSLNVFESIMSQLIECSKLFENKLKYIDIGGGFFGDKPNTPTFNDYAEAIINKMHSNFDPLYTTLIIEPGASLVASPFSYVFKVLDVKKIKDSHFISVDGSNYHINSKFDNRKFKINLLSETKGIAKKQVICGFTCVENDRIATLINENKLSAGDYLFIDNIGSYTIATAPMFIKFFPAVVVKNHTQCFYARKEWEAKDYLTKSYLDNKMIIG